MKQQANRRDFIKAAATAVAVPYLVPGSALGADGRPAPSNRIVMGGIGIGSQGSGDESAFLSRKDVQYIAACDVHSGRLQAAVGRANDWYGFDACKPYRDYRDLLARNDIDAVHVATPDHWHIQIVVDACRAGKDVYCQKPETRTLREGPIAVAAARRYNRVVSGGSQRVLEDYWDTVSRCWSGALGPIKSINVNEARTPTLCYLPGEPVPSGFDWDMWLGPAPWAPYHPYRCSGSFSIDGTSWRSFSDYSGGGLTDWGAHHYGGAIFAIDCRELQPEEVTYHNDSGREWLSFRYPNGILLTNSRPGSRNLQVEGTPGEKKPSKPVPVYKGKNPDPNSDPRIYDDFIECVKTRERPFRDIELAVNTAAVCHLSNIAYQLKRNLKWDSAKCEFPGDAEANGMVERARREPWTL